MDRWLVGVGSGLLAALIWAGFPVATRFAVAHSQLDGYDVTFLRYAVAGLVMLPVLVRQGFGGVGPVPVVLMVAGVGAPYILVVAAGLASAPVGTFAVLSPGSMIVYAAILGRVLLAERLSRRQSAGLLAVICGIALTGWSQLRASQASAEAIALFLSGGLLWAIFTVTAKIHAVTALRATAIVSTLSAAVYCPIYLVVKGGAVFQAPPQDLLVQAVYQGILVSVVALFLFSRGIAILGATLGAAFAALVPAFAVVEASLLLGEKPPMLSLFGLAVVSAGMIGSLMRPRLR